MSFATAWAVRSFFNADHPPKNKHGPRDDDTRNIMYHAMGRISTLADLLAKAASGCSPSAPRTAPPAAAGR